jgi:hypothetical protein
LTTVRDRPKAVRQLAAQIACKRSFVFDSEGVVRAAADHHQACALQNVVAIARWRVSSDFTFHVPKKNGHLPKQLNQRDFIEPGTPLAAIRGQERSYDTNTAQGSQMKSILDHSFRYTRSIDTDLRKTFARIRREQRQQAQAHGKNENPRKVFPIRQPRRAVAS